MASYQDNEKANAVSPPQIDPYLVTFIQPFDDDNPKDWSIKKKWLVTGVLSSTGFNRIMVSTIMAPAMAAISKDLDMSNVESTMALSIYLLATAFGPLFIGPLSEVYGRQKVLHATNIWFLIWNILCGFAHTKGTLIASRFLAGLGASAVYALAGGVLGDIWRPEERGRSLGLYLLIPLLGAAVGPIIGGYVVENTTWRWIFWSTSILQGFMVLLSFLFFHETHASTILLKRAKKLRRNNVRYYTSIERLEHGRSVISVVSQSLTRPIRLLLFHPIVQVQAVVSGFGYGILYLVLSTFSDLWTKQYHESVSTSGLHYLALCIGEVAGAELGGPLMDIIFHKLKAKARGVATPEFRIPLMIPGAILAPVGLFIYGWAAQRQIQWSVVDVGAAIFTFGSQITGQALQAYVIDSYPDHASSASAASQFSKSMTAFAFPLFAPMMYNALGYGWGNSLVAFVTLAVGLPAPLLIWKYGSSLRAKAQSSY